MLPKHLSSNTPSTSTASSDPFGKGHGTVGNGTLRYMYPAMPLVGSMPLRIRVPPVTLKDGFNAYMTVGQRSHVERKFNTRPTTVAARKRQKLPMRPGLHNLMEHTPSRQENTYEESSQFNPAQLDSVSLGNRRNSHLRASQGNLSNAGGTMVMYDRQQQGRGVMAPGYVANPVPYDAMPMHPPPPPPVWYPAPPPLPVYFCAPPPHMDSKEMKKMMKSAMLAENKMFRSQKKPSPCYQFCCGGVAGFLWCIIAIVLLACISIFILCFVNT